MRYALLRVRLGVACVPAAVLEPAPRRLSDTLHCSVLRHAPAASPAGLLHLQLQAHVGPVTALAVSADGTMCASISTDRTAKVRCGGSAAVVVVEGKGGGLRM